MIEVLEEAAFHLYTVQDRERVRLMAREVLERISGHQNHPKTSFQENIDLAPIMESDNS